MSETELTMEFARRDDCLDCMVPSDLRLLIGDRDRLRARLAAIERRARELVGVLESDAAMAYEAADYNRATGYRHSAKKLRDFLDMSGNNDRG